MKVDSHWRYAYPLDKIRFCEFVYNRVCLQAKPAKISIYKALRLAEIRKLTDKALDVANVLSHSFKLSQDGNVIALFYNTKNTIPIRNVIDVRDALLGTFDDPIEFLVPILSEHLVTLLYGGAILRDVRHFDLNADSFNIKNNTRLINTVLETKWWFRDTWITRKSGGQVNL